MNTSKLADIAEITSSIAILVTLVFLVVQMQQNSDALQANARSAILGATMDHLQMRVDNPHLNLNMVKSELSDLEKSELNDYLISFFRLREHDWLQYQEGALDETTWKAYLSSISSVLAYQRTRTWWGNTRTFDPDFILEVDELIANTPILEYPVSITRFD